jgi:hypothetical protein
MFVSCFVKVAKSVRIQLSTTQKLLIECQPRRWRMIQLHQAIDRKEVTLNKSTNLELVRKCFHEIVFLSRNSLQTIRRTNWKFYSSMISFHSILSDAVIAWNEIEREGSHCHVGNLLAAGMRKPPTLTNSSFSLLSRTLLKQHLVMGSDGNHVMIIKTPLHCLLTFSREKGLTIYREPHIFQDAVFISKNSASHQLYHKRDLLLSPRNVLRQWEPTGRVRF